MPLGYDGQIPYAQLPLNFRQNFTLTGIPSGSEDISGDFSGAATKFFIKPAPAQIFILNRIDITLTTSGGLTSAGYGGGAMLINGLIFSKIVNGETTSFVNTILSNFDLLESITEVVSFPLQGNAVIIKGLIDFDVVNQNQIVLNGATGDEISLVVEDDFTTRVVAGFQKVIGVGTEVVKTIG